jgi:hypothetical protein
VIYPAFLARTAALFAVVMLFAGCGHEHREGHGHDHAETGHGPDDGHGHEEESPSGAAFKAGKGVVVTDETKKILHVTVAAVTQQKLPAQIRFNLQVFGEKHRPALREDDHSGCDAHGAGFLPPDEAAAIRIGQPVQIELAAGQSLAGVVLAVTPPVLLGEAEVIVGLTNATSVVKPGDFLSASVTLPRDEVVRVIPRSALLRTAEGTFVYAVNGDAYLRRAVTVGAAAADFLEITAGLDSADFVVTHSVETLHLIELRATKGGGHSH